MSVAINEPEYKNSLANQEPGHEVANLVRQALAGEPKAFDQLVERFEGTIYAIGLRRLRNHSDAQELAQEVFLRAFSKLYQLEDPRCFAGWIRSIAVRMAINRAVRRRPILTDEVAIFDSEGPEQEGPVQKVLAQERSYQVHAGLGRLGQMDRETLWAYYFKGQSIGEMSNAFETPVGTIKRRLFTARHRLAKELTSLTVN
jgi:RNA polymerase sigma-70 factor, ECF subfamily